MRSVDRLIAAAAVALGAAAFSACSTPQTNPLEDIAAISGDSGPAIIVAPHRPPPRRAEIPPPAPSPQALWRFGQWRWNGVGYVWTPGRYVERPTPSANWIPGYWDERPEGWVWVEGQWTS